MKKKTVLLVFASFIILWCSEDAQGQFLSRPSLHSTNKRRQQQPLQPIKNDQVVVNQVIRHVFHCTTDCFLPFFAILLLWLKLNKMQKKSMLRFNGKFATRKCSLNIMLTGFAKFQLNFPEIWAAASQMVPIATS